MFLWFLGGILATSFACSFLLGQWKGAVVIVLLLAIGLWVSVAKVGDGVLLVAAYAGGPVLLAAAIGLIAGSALRRKRRQ